LVAHEGWCVLARQGLVRARERDLVPHGPARPAYQRARMATRRRSCIRNRYWSMRSTLK
jgi:hypothetical protein